jgi:hypothetical protein
MKGQSFVCLFKVYFEVISPKSLEKAFKIISVTKKKKTGPVNVVQRRKFLRATLAYY